MLGLSFNQLGCYAYLSINWDAMAIFQSVGMLGLSFNQLGC